MGGGGVARARSDGGCHRPRPGVCRSADPGRRHGLAARSGAGRPAARGLPIPRTAGSGAPRPECRFTGSAGLVGRGGRLRRADGLGVVGLARRGQTTAAHSAHLLRRRRRPRPGAPRTSSGPRGHSRRRRSARLRRHIVVRTTGRGRPRAGPRDRSDRSRLRPSVRRADRSGPGGRRLPGDPLHEPAATVGRRTRIDLRNTAAAHDRPGRAARSRLGGRGKTGALGGGSSRSATRSDTSSRCIATHTSTSG